MCFVLVVTYGRHQQHHDLEFGVTFTLTWLFGSEDQYDYFLLGYIVGGI